VVTLTFSRIPRFRAICMGKEECTTGVVLTSQSCSSLHDIGPDFEPFLGFHECYDEEPEDRFASY